MGHRSNIGGSMDTSMSTLHFVRHSRPLSLISAPPLPLPHLHPTSTETPGSKRQWARMPPAYDLVPPRTAAASTHATTLPAEVRCAQEGRLSAGRALGHASKRPTGGGAGQAALQPCLPTAPLQRDGPPRLRCWEATTMIPWVNEA